jgi:hypothetical protein
MTKRDAQVSKTVILGAAQFRLDLSCNPLSDLVLRTKATSPKNLGAWELFHRGMALIARRTRDGNSEARHLLE